MGSSLDCPGPITNMVEDAAIVMNVIAGKDENDATTSDLAVPDYTKDLNKDIKSLKIGVPKEYFGLGLDKEVEEKFKNSLKIYEKLGAEIVDITLPHTEYALAAYYVIQTAETSSNLGRYDGVKYGFSAKNSKDLIDSYFKTRDEGFGDEAKRRIMLGTYVLSAGYYDAYYLKAAKVRRLIHDDFVKAFEKVDVIITPTAPTPAFKIGEKVDPVSMYLADVFTVPASMAGVPAISIPAGFSGDKLPIGIQVIGPHFEESKILNVANMFEKATENEEWRKFKTVI
jgi:aspartyl-tRNA(Asn)/glutamyl-tRNA(Gln) amidotransferase subunit A